MHSIMCMIFLMDTTANYQKWSAQLRKGYLELCVLVVIRQKQSSYGLEVLQTLEESGLAVNEGTLYPLLNRMFKNNWLSSEWVTPSEGGHPRRHYQLSEEGLSLLPQMLETFQQNQLSLDQLKELK